MPQASQAHLIAFPPALVFDGYASQKHGFGNRRFWAEDCHVSTFGVNEATTAKCIREQERADIALDLTDARERECPAGVIPWHSPFDGHSTGRAAMGPERREGRGLESLAGFTEICPKGKPPAARSVMFLIAICIKGTGPCRSSMRRLKWQLHAAVAHPASSMARFDGGIATRRDYRCRWKISDPREAAAVPDSDLKQMKAVKDRRGVPAGPGPAGRRFEHRICVHARPKDVWKVLSDIPGWGSWAVMYPAAHGQLVEDGQFKVTLKVPGTPAFQSTSSHVHFRENRFLSYLPSTIFPRFLLSSI